MPAVMRASRQAGHDPIYTAHVREQSFLRVVPLLTRLGCSALVLSFGDIRVDCALFCCMVTSTPQLSNARWKVRRPGGHALRSESSGLVVNSTGTYVNVPTIDVQPRMKAVRQFYRPTQSDEGRCPGHSSSITLLTRVASARLLNPLLSH